MSLDDVVNEHIDSGELENSSLGLSSAFEEAGAELDRRMTNANAALRSRLGGAGVLRTPTKKSGDEVSGGGVSEATARLILHAVRQLVEVTAAAVSLLLVCDSHVTDLTSLHRTMLILRSGRRRSRRRWGMRGICLRMGRIECGVRLRLAAASRVGFSFGRGLGFVCVFGMLTLVGRSCPSLAIRLLFACLNRN